MDKPQAIIIGAGFTGCALAHDLALRNFAVTVVERGELTSGTSGRTHGLLHSGGRYCVNDQEAAIECIDENILLRKIAKQCIEFNGGLFIALTDTDEAYADTFATGAEACHIPIERLTAAETLRLEPAVNPNVRLSFRVPDGAFDPLRLALAFAATAARNGAKFHAYTQAENLTRDGQGNVTGVEVWDRTTGKHYSLRGDIVINATGAWAGEVAKMAGLHVGVVPTPGVMVAYNARLIQRVINRLAPPGDGDIIIPQRRMMCIGTTSFEVADIDYIPVFDDQVEWMHRSAIELVPGVQQTRERGAWMSARPLVGRAEKGRSMSRTFVAIDHKETDGIGGLVTITGGKATTCRGMAEKTADTVCKNLGLNIPCQTKEIPLESYRAFYRYSQESRP
jgi:glycerol-3-phosphate dehydrogenase